MYLLYLGKFTGRQHLTEQEPHAVFMAVGPWSHPQRCCPGLALAVLSQLTRAELGAKASPHRHACHHQATTALLATDFQGLRSCFQRMDPTSSHRSPSSWLWG